MRIFQKSTSIKTKKGATSIYIVAFTTMVLSILTISFVRIMVSEAQQTSNYDLSQSAYDSALAGIEDAGQGGTKSGLEGRVVAIILCVKVSEVATSITSR